MTFNTAVFYDIENLLKGYAFSAQMLSNLSLREILDSVAKTGRPSAIAIQRAYANWSDPRLSVMRGEINELGIEPVQVFGFSRDQKKNAADIQLAIDAIDLAHIRPSIEVFVIVSGDGGFASLAKKLHEYGKTVIGCAYASAANRIFQAVCDEFVSIADPEDARPNATAPRADSEGSRTTTPLVHRMDQSVKRIQSGDRDAIINKAKEVLQWVAKDRSSQSDLLGRGLHLSVVSGMVRHAIPDFDPGRVGFAKFVEFLQFACVNTGLHVVRSPDGVAVLACRSQARSETDVLPDLGLGYLHSAENYRSALAAGWPSFRLPEPDDLFELAAWIGQNPLRDTDLGTAIETVASGLGGSVSSEATKRALLCFISAEILDREPAGEALGEQKLTLKANFGDGPAILDALKSAALKKLRGALGDVQVGLLDEMMPANLTVRSFHSREAG